MHRDILSPPRHQHVDHANIIGTDNRRANLRLALTRNADVTWHGKDLRDGTSAPLAASADVVAWALARRG